MTHSDLPASLAPLARRTNAKRHLRSRLFLGPDLGPVFGAWLRECGVPEALIFTPVHFSRFADIYADKSVRSDLYGIQHDEKDVYRIIGPRGIQDWGDGVAQEFLSAYNSAVGQIDTEMTELKKLGAATQPSADRSAAVVASLLNAERLHAEQEPAAAAKKADAEAKVAKLTRKIDTLSGARIEQRTRLEKQRRFLEDRVGEAETYTQQLVSHRAVVAALLPTRTVAEQTALLDVSRALLETGFGLAHTAASKALALCFTSPFECHAWGVGSLAFTVDEAKTWQIREVVHRAMVDSYRDNRMIPVFVGADKAYMSATTFDAAGFARTATAAKREVEYMTTLVTQSGGVREVSVSQWPRTADVKAWAEGLLAHPQAVAAGITRQAWMNDPNRAATRERWRDFLLSANVKKLRVWCPGRETLEQEGWLDRSARASAPVPLNGLLKPGLERLARDTPRLLNTRKKEKAEGLSATELKRRLIDKGVTHSHSVLLSELTAVCLRKETAVRQAMHRRIDKAYRECGRDFRYAHSYPEYVDVEEGLAVPVVNVWDDPHGLKNARMASANDSKRTARAGAAATAEAAAGGEEDGEGQLFDDDQTLEDAQDEMGGQGLEANEGTLAHAVALAAQAVIAVKEQSFIHSRTMDPSHDPQHVPTAVALFSHATAEEMRRLGHIRAADWVHKVASRYLATDKRGFTPAERWVAWADHDRAIYELDASLRLDPDDPMWHSPKTSSIEGYSRVLVESWLVSSASKREVDLMVGAEGIFVRYYRRDGSDLCECLFSRCVATMGEDKSSKWKWLRLFGKIVRQARRQTMDPATRQSPMFTQQHTVYENKEFVLGFCSCKSTPRCVIGGAVTPGCICEQGNRHTKSDAKLRQKITGHEPSTRHKFHVKFMPGDIDGVIENTDHHAEDVREDAAAVVDAAAAEEVDGEEDEGAGPAKDTRLDF